MKRLILYLILFFLASCKKNFDNTSEINKIVLPNYSESGANTFGFMLNNSVWTVFGKHYVNLGVGSVWQKNNFEVSTINTGINQVSVVGGGRMTIVKNDSAITDISAGFSFVPTQPFTKSYYLTTVYPGNFSIFDIAKNKYYKVNSLRPFTLQLNKFDKIDPLWRICSGRFFGVMYNELDMNDSLVITDGRFDTKVIYR